MCHVRELSAIKIRIEFMHRKETLVARYDQNIVRMFFINLMFIIKECIPNVSRFKLKITNECSSIKSIRKMRSFI